MRPAQLQALFADKASEVASLAVIPLSQGEAQPCLGLLGVGSFEAERFHPAMGTMFLSHLGMIVAQALKPHLAS